MKVVSQQGKKRIAVVGAGAAGLSVAYLLSKRNEVVLFESSNSLGGHAHAELVEDKAGKSFYVDTAFLIFNDKTYPNFIRFIEQLGVDFASVPAEMSSCFSNRDSDFHYALGNGLAPFLSEPKTLFRKELPQILMDLRAFRIKASKDLETGTDLSDVTAAEYLSSFSPAFTDNFVLPLTAAIWSLPAECMRNYPIKTLLDYFQNHQLLKGKSERRWRTFQGSSAVYVNAFKKQFDGAIRLNTKIHSVVRTQHGVAIHSDRGEEFFDSVVMATHADTSARLIQNKTADEIRLLGAWKYQDNPVTLHTDEKVLHPNPKLWCSWNMTRNKGEYQISYYLNRLQSLPSDEPVILTLGEREIAEDKILKQFNYRHPVFSNASVATQNELNSLNGTDRIYFCGSYFGFGFHEDAVRSAFNVARHFNIDWDTVAQPSYRIRIQKNGSTLRLA